MHFGILILSAHPPELSGLRTTLGDDLSGTSSGVVVQARPVGIGLAAAAAGTASALHEVEPRAVILVGTCGAYAGGGVGISEVVVGRRLCLISTAVAQNRAAFPAPMHTSADASAPLSVALAQGGAREVVIATTLAITTDDVLAAQAAGHRGCHVEHLEAFGVAEACAARGVPLAVVLGVANMVGASAREEWRQNHLQAGDAAGALVARWLERGAPGVRS